MKNFHFNTSPLPPTVLWIGICVNLILIFACQKSTSHPELYSDSNAAVKSIQSTEEFDRIMASSHENLIVIDFYADWCGPCRQLGPILEKIAGEMDKNARFYKVNIDDHRLLSMKNGVTGIPYVAFFKKGQKVHSLMGIWPKDSYIRTINQFTFSSKEGQVEKGPEGEFGGEV